MKRIISLFVLLAFYLPIFGMAQEHGVMETDCGDLVYRAVKCVLHTDFIVLSHHDSWYSKWLLARKLKLRDYAEDRDKYYLRFGRVINGRGTSIFTTPLHEAIYQGNFQAVKLLCDSGVDITKKIKLAQEVEASERAEEAYRWRIFRSNLPEASDAEVDTYIARFQDLFSLGLTAVEFAEKKAATQDIDKQSERAEIVDYLRALSKQE